MLYDTELFIPAKVFLGARVPQPTGTGAAMGLIHVDAIIAHPGNTRKTAKLTFLVDSGAIYSVVPRAVLHKLGVKAHSRRTFTLADGSQITRRVGDASFKFNDQQGASPVIFGEEGDSTLLGTLSLAALGFVLDPIRRELRPLPLILGAQSPNPLSGPVEAEEDIDKRPLSEVFDRYDETILHGE